MPISKVVKKGIRKVLAELGYIIIPNKQFRSEFKPDNERELKVDKKELLIQVLPDKSYPHTILKIRKGSSIFHEKLLYGHLGLIKLVTDYDFNSILDIGSRNGTAAKAFQFLDKQVTTIEFSNDFASDYSGDYLDAYFTEKFDAIWCSHVLEHQRNLGLFLEKIFNDLKEGGILALTVPTVLSPFIIGHSNIFTPLTLIYNLVLAGFDCRQAKLKCYSSQMTIIIKKSSNGIKPLSFASTHYSDISPDGTGFIPDLCDYFPVKIPNNEFLWGEIDAINWS